MRLVIIESPFAGDVVTHKKYLQRCIRDCIKRGESPYASHQMLTEALDDLNPEERKLGIEAGFAWRKMADATVVYLDYGQSRGMTLGIAAASALGVTGLGHAIELRNIGRNEDKD